MKKGNKKEWILLITVLIVISIGYFTTKWYVGNRYDYYVVEGSSMLPNIQNNDELKIDKNKKVSRYDIVIIEVGNSTLVKRVIGIPGDVLRFTKEDTLYINNEEIIYPFSIQGITRTIDEEIKLDYQFYYVLGDNRDDAYDSRTFGKVSKSQILGVVVDVKIP